MNRNKRMIMSVIWVILGIALFGLSFAEKVDSFWSGMGSGLFTVGILQLIRFYRFSKNEAYREKMEIAESDERNHFIRGKAWAWAGYLYILIAACSIIVFRVIGQEMLSTAASFSVCLVLVLYWISYMILRKKY